MTTTWAVTLLLVGFFSVYDVVVCPYSSYRSYRGYTAYRTYRSYRSYGTYRYCSSSLCRSTSSSYSSLYALISPAFVFLVSLGGLILYCYIKKKTRPGRIVRPSPPESSPGISGGIEPSNGEQPFTHYPMPLTIKANGAPPPYDSLDPAHPAGQNTNSGQINTRTLPPGTIRPPPSVPAPAWQAPPPGAPSQSDNPPMPQPDPPKTSPSNEALCPQPPPVVTAAGVSGIHPPPALTPLPPSDQAETTAVPTEGGDAKEDSY